MKLECFPMAGRPPEIVPGRPSRDWMDAFDDRHAYRCLPMTMANTTGWEILCPVGFWAEWNGGPSQTDITFRADHPYPDFTDFVKSHFSQGIMTFHTGYMFRTPERWSLWTGGPPNHMKDGIAPLAGIVETDWLPFPFTMNWRFTRPGRVYFAKGEPFCFIMPVQDKALEEFDLVQRSLEREPELNGQFEAWTARRAEFNDKLFRRDPETVREAWQRYYFKGEMPDESGPAPKEHVNKRRLRNLRLGA